MKNLENCEVKLLGNKEMKEAKGGWTDYTNDGYYGGEPWTGGGVEDDYTLRDFVGDMASWMTF